MKFDLEINIPGKIPFSKKYFEKIISRTIGMSGEKIRGKLSFSLAMVSEKEIRKLNRIYRKKDKVTDILSFSEYSKGKKGREKEGDVFCELVLCYSYIKRSSESDGIPLKTELAYVVSHGVLHCIGWKHGKKMYEVQDKVCEKI